jgi:D-alanyl-D-alanine carboxypeptidase (penicillin-binding protein 5/6)
VELAANVEAPVEKGQVLGSVTLKLGEEELGKFNLTAAEAVGRLTFGQAFLRLLRSLAA